MQRMIISILFIFTFTAGITSQQSELYTAIAQQAEEIEDQVIEWRRHLHQYPELSNREFKTAKYIESHLRTLGIEVYTGIAKTGVVGVLKTGNPGPVVALRADMDALPVRERVDIPFASKEEDYYLGQKVGVMHACGHDSHVAMLMGAATILSSMKDRLQGTIVFVFQPAEEGAPPGEEGGAKLMVEEGIIERFGIDVFFGLHISSALETGKIMYKPLGMMAAADVFNIRVLGKQTHGSTPWTGIDPITVSAQIILGLQTIISRQTELTKEAAVISVGKITGGVRNNIIPEEVEMTGTIRTLDTVMQRMIHEKIVRTAEGIAQSAGAIAEVSIIKGYPVTFNSPELTVLVLPTLEFTAGEKNLIVTRPITGAEDFSFFANKVPSFFFFLGGRSPETSPLEAAPHHTPDFFIDESGFGLGIRALCNLAIDYTSGIHVKMDGQ
ncbi:MAG TPA: amidohydrolase [Saprospiraceae bacterium]|nr:amidohydrolase [Saprospiraceae bacterium]